VGIIEKGTPRKVVHNQGHWLNNVGKKTLILMANFLTSVA
jgi:hypothetical protein